MDGTPLIRMHWRLRGAWMWPAFIVFTVVDGVLLHELPVVGDSAALVGMLILAFVLNLVVVVVVSPTLGALLRRRFKDMPKVVSNDYAGTIGIVVTSIAIATGGLIHHPVVGQDQAAQTDAAEMAQGYIADHVKHAQAYDLRSLSVLPIQPPSRYRVCAVGISTGRWYCVSVTVPIGGQPLPGANYDGARVMPAGSESNQLLSEGTN